MSHFKLHTNSFDLQLRQPFTISRGSKSVVHNVLVKLSADGITGLGEAAPNSRYNEDAQKVLRYVETLPADFFDNIASTEALASKLDDHQPGVQSAKAAVEMAWLDWHGKQKNQPLWKLWKAPARTGPVTSYTIGLDEISVMQQKVRQAAGFPVYKVKLGTGRDRKIIRALREVTDKPLRVDANEGWTTLTEAREMIAFLSDQNVELIEQPMPAGHLADLKKLKDSSDIPLCADESFMGDEPLAEIAEMFDIINIKLMKIGSLYKALQVIKKAQKASLKVMIGCMIESSIANTAGALLSLWADYADLDGHLLISDDPARGVQLTNQKRLRMPDEPGLGVQMKIGD